MPDQNIREIGTEYRLEEVQNHLEMYQRNFLSEPGWIHLIIRHAGNEYPDIFNEDVEGYEEGWYLLDSDGRVTTGIARLVDKVGQPTFVSVLEKGKWKNLTTGSEHQIGEEDHFRSGYDFYEQALKLVNKGEHLSKQIRYDNCWYIGEKYAINCHTFHRYTSNCHT